MEEKLFNDLLEGLNEAIAYENDESNRLELYRLLGEGYKAVEEGCTSPMEDVIERIEKRRYSMDTLKIAEEERQEYREMLNEK